MTPQLDLFNAIMHSYTAENGGRLSNAALYEQVAQRAGIDQDDMTRRVPVGEAAQPHNLIARKIRWAQQDLKRWQVLTRIDGERGVWGLTDGFSRTLNKAKPSVSVLAFSTALGIAIMGSCDSVFTHIDAPVVLSITSPPYPLAHERAYGNVAESVYVDWICKALEPTVKCLVRGGSICINVGQDIFMPGSPERSMYCERLVLALHDRLGLKLIDRLIWENTSKPPGPTQWACINRVQLAGAWEPVYWFSNSPKDLRSDNRRVLQAHTDRHLALMKRGGETREGVYCDGAHRIKKGSYGKVTEGKIAKNILKFSHNCASQRAYKQRMREMGMQAHGAPMPVSLAKFLIEFMSEKDEVVIDPFFGSGSTGVAAEQLGRRWIGTEIMLQTIVGAATRFEQCEGFEQVLRAA